MCHTVDLEVSLGHASVQCMHPPAVNIPFAKMSEMCHMVDLEVSLDHASVHAQDEAEHSSCLVWCMKIVIVDTTERRAAG